jgi:hypothetical protein
MYTERNSSSETETSGVGEGFSTTPADRAAAARITVDGETVRPVSPEPSLGQLFADLSSDFSRLARQEIQLARAETMQSLWRGRLCGGAAAAGRGDDCPGSRLG